MVAHPPQPMLRGKIEYNYETRGFDADSTYRLDFGEKEPQILPSAAALGQRKAKGNGKGGGLSGVGGRGQMETGFTIGDEYY